MNEQESRRLANSRDDLKSDYSVVIVGSGYGGGVAAARLARTGRSVCVFERGKEFIPGDFPDTEAAVQREIQARITQEEADEKRLGSASGLYDFHIDHDISVFRGCGLGGTSLINAGVSLQADPAVFEEPCWPDDLISDLEDGLATGFSQATQMLQPLEYPESAPPLAKMSAHERSAEALGEPFRKLPLSIGFTERINAFGILQNACILCGDCMTGCNYGASNTVAMNYLPDAKQHGAEIYTQMEVRRVERTFDGKQWRVYYYPLEEGKEFLGSSDEQFVTTDCVVLSAGALGSTEILLRSKHHGLSVSEQLGQSFSGNADLLGFGYNSDRPVNAVGTGGQDLVESEPVGPAVTCAIDARGERALQEQYLIEDGCLPGALEKIYPAVLAAAEPLIQKGSGTKGKEFLKEKWRKVESVFRGARFGAIANTQTYFVSAHDSSAGEVQLVDDQLQICWPGVSAEKVFEDMDSRLSQASQANGGVYITNPPWSPELDSRLMTFQPLGGCSMADDAADGVTNHKGQVYSDKQGTEVHAGLYVADGALMPMSLGANPLLTITALAERNMALLAEDYGWTISEESGIEVADFKSGEPAVPVAATSEEILAGYWSPESGEDSDYEVAFNAGADNDQLFELTILQDESGDDAGQLIDSNHHESDFSGSANVPALSGEPLEMGDGIIIRDRNGIDELRVTYEAIISAASGEQWLLSGYAEEGGGETETPDNDSPAKIYFEVREFQVDDEDDHHDFVGKGILKFRSE